VPGRVAQVHFNHPVIGPLGPVPGRVGEEDHMGGREEHSTGVVLGRVEGAVLQVLSKGVEVVSVVSCCP